MKTLLGTILLCGAFVVGCGDSGSAPGDLGNTGRPDMTVSGSDGGDGGVTNPDMTPGCVSNPMTNDEIINACTTAQSYDKLPFYPTNAPNGVLPPLP